MSSLKHINDLRKLTGTVWFHSISSPLCSSLDSRNTALANSLDHAIQLCSDQNVIWCRTEAINRVLDVARKAGAERFSSFSKDVRSIPAEIDALYQLVDIPDTLKSNREQLFASLKPLLIGAAMELLCADIYSDSILTEAVGTLSLGRFPCGFKVSTPEDFPSSSTLTVY
jgi:hypothetical protein